mmetsp:Transcript_11359/g.25444  ORF Transcript_11359/g.25444 Transcript_11359/m.25444 type:complete len:380 (-) Transcript_11359:194-1333(-)|eukprot:CAMPEP_0170608134 /NCGR_PEP_ID=MMETSP0224-20130122/21424_1 /TAXON_ID=285029 /ORGANISM="Togula jolla, Strain CCCM 725" /LENGTH=379 /DNA_ID=CAMNT_0010933343 /DNA_START=124 /DNA_END=1263 /DNA_ORIENTATION=+
MNFLAVTAIYVVVGGLGVGIFLWGKPDGNSLFDRLYRVICVHLPGALKKALEKCCGKRAPKALDAAWVYVCYTSNPLVQIFYLIIVVGGFMAFVHYGFPHVPSRLVSSFHKYTGFGVFVTCLTVWWWACRSDPGTVTMDNVDELCEIYEWDEQIFSAGDCKTCNQLKPGRSKHCSLCNFCVVRFDHHCIWINNCVGIGNHRWFLGFLFWHLVLCLYGAGMGTVLIYEITMKKDLFSAVFVDPVTKERHQASYGIILQYMFATEGALLFVTMLCTVMGLVLCGFFMWHLNLVRIGTTTNELSKWNYLRWCLKQEEGGKDRLKELSNMYNKGLIANFREVFFPIDVHALPGRRRDDVPIEPAHKASSDSGKQKSRKGKKKD